MEEKNSIKPLHIHIPDADVEALYHRLKETRWMPPIEGSNWADGTDGEYLHDLVAYWASQYNWCEREAWLNTFNHFTADIEARKFILSTPKAKVLIQSHYCYYRGGQAALCKC